MSSKATVIGDGGWGTALALVLQQNGFDVTVWGPFAESIEETSRLHRNENFLPGVDLPESIQWTTDYESATADAGTVVLAVPTQYFRDVITRFKGLISPEANIVSVTKGLDGDTHSTMTGLAEDILGVALVAALSGPSHAEEVARGVPTAVVIASRSREQAGSLQQAFSNQRFRAYTSSDVMGVQLGGALKNVIAIAVGISDGLGFGDNTRAALITRGLAEISRLGIEMGCDPATFAGLSGMGDLIVTCTSQHSRNRSVGERLGRGETISDILGNMKQVAEGVWNCSSAHALGKSRDIELPIIEEVYRILKEGKSPQASVEELMERDVKPE
jgi:glycerol-3-phosphate dehydrogenase (NAD(P)+)